LKFQVRSVAERIYVEEEMSNIFSQKACFADIMIMLRDERKRV